MPQSSKRRKIQHKLLAVTPQLLICLVMLKTKNSQKVAQMVVDTGASFTLIPYEIAAVLGLHPEHSKEREEIITASGIIDAPVLEIPLVSALGVEVRNFKVLCHDLPRQSRVEGLLGVDFLSHFPPYQDFYHEVTALAPQFWKA